jgi:hypothetical protein
MSHSIKHLKNALASPITSVLDAQHTVNLHTLDLIDKYNDDTNGFQFKNYKVKNENSTYDINVPVLSMVQIPSLTVSKFNITMNVEDKLIDFDHDYNCDSSESSSSSSSCSSSEIDVYITTEKSIFKNYNIDMEVTQGQQPLGLTKLNQLLYEFINIKQELIPKTD